MVVVVVSFQDSVRYMFICLVEDSFCFAHHFLVVTLYCSQGGVLVAVDIISTVQISNVTDISIMADKVKLAGWVSQMNMTSITHMMSFMDEVSVVLIIMSCSFSTPHPTKSILLILLCFSGGRRGPFMGGHYPSAGGSSSRPYIDGPWHGAPDRGYGMHIPPRRLPYSPEGHFGRLPMGGHFDRPPMGGHFDEPYFYDDNTQGIKRPFHMRVSFP